MPVYKIATTNSTYITPDWCNHCVGSPQVVNMPVIGTAVACQAQCARDSDCDYFYHKIELGHAYCFFKRYYSAEVVLAKTNDASCDPLYQPSEGSAGPKNCDVDIVVTYLDGPRVSNFGARHCSDWYGTLGDAMYVCNAHEDCVGLHDFDCNNAAWRWCSNSIESLMHPQISGGRLADDTKACTKVKSSSGGPA